MLDQAVALQKLCGQCPFMIQHPAARVSETQANRVFCRGTMTAMHEIPLDEPATRNAEHGQSRATNVGIACLAVASSSLDVITFLTLDQVFASAMTGNSALLGIAISRGNWVAASKPAIALIGFVIGTATATAASNANLSSARQRAALMKLLLLEATCLAIFALARQPSSDGMPIVRHSLLILLCAFSMGIQVVVAKTVGAKGVSTIVFTSTVAAAASSVVNILLGRQSGPQVRDDTVRQVLSFAAYVCGAVIAGILAWSKFVLLAWLPVTAVLLALVCFKTREYAGRK